MMSFNFNKLISEFHKDKIRFLDKNKSWIILAILIILTLILNNVYIKDLNSLPSPLYGGDYYFQLGQINHVINGGNPFKSSVTTNELPTYLPLYSIIVGYTARLFNLDAIDVIFLFSFIFTALSIVIIYILVQRLFNNYILSIISSLYIITMISFPLVKYSEFATFVMAPLFLLVLFNFHNDKSYLNSFYLALIFGLSGISHVMLFVAISLLLFSYFLYYEVYKNKNNKNIIKYILNNIGYYLIIMLIGLPIALLWWYHPLFTFHIKTSSHFSEVTYIVFTAGYQLKFFWFFIKTNFLSLSSVKTSFISFFNILGLLGIFTLTQRKEKNINFLKFLFISSFIIIFHYFITENIINFNFPPDHMIRLLFRIIIIILSIFGIYTFNTLITRLRNTKNYSKEIIKYTSLFIILIFMFSIINTIEIRKNDRWYNAGKNNLPPHLIDLNLFMENNVDINSLILTTKEVGFALNAVTARKLLSFRRGHAPAYLFIDSDQRELDQALILYGNDTELKKELIKRYKLEYLYWDYYWVQSEFYFDDKGNLINWFDPLILFYSEEKEEILRNNNINYFIETTWVDPAIKHESIPKFKLIFISPENYYNSSNPWNPNLNQYLEEIWSYEQQNQKISKLYKLKI